MRYKQRLLVRSNLADYITESTPQCMIILLNSSSHFILNNELLMPKFTFSARLDRFLHYIQLNIAIVVGAI